MSTVREDFTWAFHKESVFTRFVGKQRPAQWVVTPEGWYLTESSIAAKVTQMDDGRIRLHLWNGQPDPVGVLIKAKRRARGSRTRFIPREQNQAIESQYTFCGDPRSQTTDQRHGHNHASQHQRIARSRLIHNRG